ncbi:MAG: hypothetical protein AVDCRST_MAG85-3191 [uncultured Solirubrobacteraceae bacterium]|uniref:Uncharacterized protein n=1 Tax=uncultured Solirubrobacteraceae bacterium TaxID=1162706 RepID=A0A6J4TK19_9ACTN|nr:MAG: hypothetical protein AVDCRST_MAG85-3191 [uncultured Solirubrobacteraceae bacterium]
MPPAFVSVAASAPGAATPSSAAEQTASSSARRMDRDKTMDLLAG